MNEIKNRLIEYFDEQDTKHLIMLVVSVLIACGVGIYYLNDYFAPREEKLFDKKIKLIKKIKDMRNLSFTIIHIKRENKLLNTKLHNLNSDLKFLLSEIEISNIDVNNQIFLNILHNYIKKGTLINASFNIKNISKGLDKYHLNITGGFDAVNFFNFANFLKTLQSFNAIVSINSLNLEKNNNIINYDINVSIWSFK